MTEQEKKELFISILKDKECLSYVLYEPDYLIIYEDEKYCVEKRYVNDILKVSKVLNQGFELYKIGDPYAIKTM